MEHGNCVPFSTQRARCLLAASDSGQTCRHGSYEDPAGTLRSVCPTVDRQFMGTLISTSVLTFLKQFPL